MSPTWLLPAAAPYADAVSVGTMVLHLDEVPLPGLSLGATHHRGLMATAHVWPSGDVAGLAGASWMPIERPNGRLGPTLSVGGHLGPSKLDDRLTARAGFAWTLGQTWQWQGSATVFGASLWRVQGFEMQPVGERVFSLETSVGRSWGPNTVHVGVFGPFPTVGYQRQLDGWGFDVRAGSGNGVTLGMARVSVAL